MGNDAKMSWRSRINRLAGTLAFGNTAGLAFNLAGIRDKVSAGGISALTHQPTSEAAQRLRQDGYVNFTLGSPGLLAAIRARFDGLIEDDRYSKPRLNEARAKEAFSRILRDASRDLPDLRLLIDRRISAAVADSFGSEMAVYRILAWRNYHVPPDIVRTSEVFSNHWHCDTRPTSILKLFVNLSEVGPEDGAFSLLPHPVSRRTTRLMLVRRRTSEGWHRTSSLPEEAAAIHALGPPGSAILCNTERCLHRAEVPGPGRYRDIAQFQLIPARCPLRDDWEPVGDSSLGE